MTASETPNTGSENGEKKRAGRNGAAHHAEPDVANGECYVFDEKGKNQSETGDHRSPSGQKVALTIDFDFNGQIIRTIDHDR